MKRSGRRRCPCGILRRWSAHCLPSPAPQSSERGCDEKLIDEEVVKVKKKRLIIFKRMIDLVVEDYGLHGQLWPQLKIQKTKAWACSNLQP